METAVPTSLSEKLSYGYKSGEVVQEMYNMHNSTVSVLFEETQYLPLLVHIIMNSEKSIRPYPRAL